VPIGVTLHNGGSHSQRVRFRPDTLGFDVTGPSGEERCRAPTPPANPARELLTTLAAHDSASLTLDLSTYCEGPSFDRPGLLTVRPWLDTRNASGETLGIQSFNGRVAAARVTLVRLHRGRQPTPLVRPTLEPP
jgi:hypothetical protein